MFKPVLPEEHDHQIALIQADVDYLTALLEDTRKRLAAAQAAKKAGASVKAESSPVTPDPVAP